MSKPKAVQIAILACITKKALEAEVDPEPDFETHAGKALLWWDGLLQRARRFLAGCKMDAPIDEEKIANNLLTGLRTSPDWSKIISDLEVMHASTAGAARSQSTGN